MKKYILIVLLLTTTGSYAQEKVQLYRLKIDDKGLLISKLQIDSTISVLKKRLLNAGYKNSIVAYNYSNKEFMVESESVIEEEFMSNWLVKPCEVSFYETYTAIELLSVLLAYPNHDIDLDKKKAFYTLLNISDSIINDRKISNVGVIKISDTTEFNKVKKDLKSYLPEDCLLAYEQNQTLLEKPALAIFALRNNTWKLPLQDMLDSIKMIVDWRGEPAISIHFNKTGTKKFAAITQKNINKAIAIVVDGLVYSAPFVNGEIEGGHAEIVGSFKAMEVKQLANMLSGGYLPIKLTLIKQATK